MEPRPVLNCPLPVKIVGVGRYLPARVVSNRELEERCHLEAGWCERKQGIRERRWVEDETISFMGAQAAAEAAADAGLALSDIDLIICASQSIDQAIPENASLIQRELGLGDSGIPCMTVTAACLGFMVALDLSASLLTVGRYRHILIVTSEITTMNLDWNNPNVCTLLGDGAAAVVVTRTPVGENSGIHAVLMETYSEAAGVSSLFKDSTRNTFFNKDFPTTGLEFEYDPQNLQSTALKYNQNFLARLWPMSNKDAIKLVIPNQASRFILYMMRFLFPADRIMDVIDHFGNTSTVGYPMALYEALKQKRIRRGDMVLMTGIGAGLSIIGIVLTY